LHFNGERRIRMLRSIWVLGSPVEGGQQQCKSEFPGVAFHEEKGKPRCSETYLGFRVQRRANPSLADLHFRQIRVLGGVSDFQGQPWRGGGNMVRI